MSNFYELTGPIELADAPEKYSYSSLKRMEECLLKWQLERSTYEDFDSYPTRPSEATLVGTVVHEVLEVLLKRLVRAGLPSRRSSTFQEVMKGCKPLELINQKLQQAKKALSIHPRGHGIQIKQTATQIFASVATAFQRQYKYQEERNKILELPKEALEIRKGEAAQAGRDVDWLKLLRVNKVLTEAHLSHPTLPIHGYIDTIMLSPEGVIIADTKTGKKYDSHREQVALYCLLWWRNTGEIPDAADVVYMSETERFIFSQDKLLLLEQELKRKIQRFSQELASQAPATLNKHCVRCDVRQYCAAYWNEDESQRQAGTSSGDIEVVVELLHGSFGFVGTTQSGSTISFVYQKDAPFSGNIVEVGARLRITSGRQNEDVFEITRWSEVFRV